MGHGDVTAEVNACLAGRAALERQRALTDWQVKTIAALSSAEAYTEDTSIAQGGLRFAGTAGSDWTGRALANPDMIPAVVDALGGPARFAGLDYVPVATRVGFLLEFVRLRSPGVASEFVARFLSHGDPQPFLNRGSLRSLAHYAYCAVSNRRPGCAWEAYLGWLKEHA